MNDHKDIEKVQLALDTTFSNLKDDPWLAQKVLANAKGEEKPVKKKISAAFILVMVLVLAAVTALAATLLWRQQVVPMKEMEQEAGDYANWGISQKQALIRALMDSGYVEGSSETEQLFDAATDEQAKHTIADQLILKLIGQTDVKEISVDIITYAIMGSSDTWTPEQRQWWQQITEQFHGDDGAPDTLVMPNGNEPTEAEAIAIAKAAILAAYELPPEALDQALPVANLYVTDERPNYRRWDIQFKFFKEGTENYLERVYTAIVDETGAVIADPDVAMPSVEEMAATSKALHVMDASTIVQSYGKYAEEGNNAPIQQWSLALKAAYSQEVRPMVLSALESDVWAYDAPLAGGRERDIIASTTYAYGLPADNAISEADARSKAQQALQERYQQNADDFIDKFMYFDVTNPAVPIWRFVYLPANLPGAAPHMCYRIELNAYTGDVVNAEEFKQGQYGESLVYDIKLY